MKHNDMIMWLVKLIFDSTVNSALRWCTLSTERKKNGIKAIYNSSVLETKTSSQFQENAWVFAGSFLMVTWSTHAGLLQVLKGGLSPDYSPAAPLLWQQWFLIFFPFCIIFVPLQPPPKRINHTTIINTAGQRVLVVGVVLAEGTSGPSPTVLQFTVNIPKTGFFNFILRYKVRCQPRLVCVFATTAHKCTPVSIQWWIEAFRKGGALSSRSWDKRGRGGSLQKHFFFALWASVWSKNRAGVGGVGPLGPSPRSATARDHMIDLTFYVQSNLPWLSNHPKWEDLMVACENSSTGGLCL